MERGLNALDITHGKSIIQSGINPHIGKKMDPTNAFFWYLTMSDLLGYEGGILEAIYHVPKNILLMFL